MIQFRTLMLAAAAVTITSMATTSAVFADTATKPTDSATPQSTPTSAPQVSSPYWNPQGDSQDSGTQYGERLMEKTVLAVPQARADAVVAEWQYRTANNHLNVKADNMHRDFVESDEYSAALANLKQAYRDLENARLDALKGLRGSDEYAAIEALRKNVNEQIADERDHDKPSEDRLVALAQLKLESIAPVRVAEQETIESSSAVKDAKQKLIDASKKVAQIESKFAHDVRDSIDLADARKAKEDARIGYLASAAYLDETRVARDIAVRYSYLSRGIVNDYGNGPSPYNGYGSYTGYGTYGSGYGYGGYSGGTAYGFLPFGTGVGNVGVVGTTTFGGGTNAFFGRGGNAIMGPGTSSARQTTTGNIPGANSPGHPFGPNPGTDIPSPFGPTGNSTGGH